MWIELGLLSTLMGALFGLAAYRRLSGRTFVRDALYAWRLKRRSLADWDRVWQDNPSRSDIIVCLSTIPSRVAHLGITLSSLLAQGVAPKRIRLHLPHRLARTGEAYVVPPWLEALRGVEIVRCEDQGPATKLLPALRDCDPDQLLLVVDDDMIYPPSAVETFENLAASEPDTAHTASGFLIPADGLDRPTTLWTNLLQAPAVPLRATGVRAPRRVDVLQGTNGYLVRPRFFDAGVFGLDDVDEAIRTVDDVWISAHCHAPKRVSPHPRLAFHPPYAQWALQRERLGAINLGDGRLENRRNSIAIAALRPAWPKEPWPDGAVYVATAADHHSAPKLTRLLFSLRRIGVLTAHRMVVFDVGLTPADRDALGRWFPNVDVRYGAGTRQDCVPAALATLVGSGRHAVWIDAEYVARRPVEDVAEALRSGRAVIDRDRFGHASPATHGWPARNAAVDAVLSTWAADAESDPSGAFRRALREHNPTEVQVPPFVARGSARPWLVSPSADARLPGSTHRSEADA